MGGAGRPGRGIPASKDATRAHVDKIAAQRAERRRSAQVVRTTHTKGRATYTMAGFTG